MHLTLQQLKLFEAVSRNSSYTRAAEELHLTQPAVSIQLKRLESHVGIPLFEQVGKKIYPTSAGKIMYQTSVDILQKIHDLDISIEVLKGIVKGPIQISLVSTTKYFMPLLLGHFLQRYPEVEPRLKFTNRARTVEHLINNQDDFVVMGQIPDESNLQAYPFLENILVVVAAPDHPLAGKKNISLKALAKHRFVEREPGSGTRQTFDRLLASHHLEVKPYMELGSSEAIKQAVIAGLGLGIQSRYSLDLELMAGKLVILDVQEFPIKRRWYAVHLKGKKLSLVAQTFLDFIIDESRDILQKQGHWSMRE